MDKRLLAIINEVKSNFGLVHYTMESYEVEKERNSKGNAYHILHMTFFPNKQTTSNTTEEALNPPGSVVICYHLQEKRVQSVIFVDEQSFSTKVHFKEKTAEEVASWIEKETGLVYGTHLKLVGAMENGFRFQAEVDGIRLASASSIDVEFDECGKLISYYGAEFIMKEEDIKKEKFTLTLEDIEPLVKKQLQLVDFPIEAKEQFSSIYAMEEVYVMQDSKRIIPFSEHEQADIEINEVLVWETKLEKKNFSYEAVPSLTKETTVEEAFDGVDIEKKLNLSQKEIEQSIKVVKEVMQVEYPTESGKWTFSKYRLNENFIEAHCRLVGAKPALLKRKVVIFIDPLHMTPINIMDNGQIFEEIFDAFKPATEVVVTHEEAFEKLLSYITLDPAYVYDNKTDKYVLCGLLDAAEGVDGATGEVISLMDL